MDGWTIAESSANFKIESAGKDRPDLKTAIVPEKPFFLQQIHMSINVRLKKTPFCTPEGKLNSRPARMTFHRHKSSLHDVAAFRSSSLCHHETISVNNIDLVLQSWLFTYILLVVYLSVSFYFQHYLSMEISGFKRADANRCTLFFSRSDTTQDVAQVNFKSICRSESGDHVNPIGM